MALRRSSVLALVLVATALPSATCMMLIQLRSGRSGSEMGSNSSQAPAIYWATWTSSSTSGGTTTVSGTITTPKSTVQVKFTNTQGIAFLQTGSGEDYFSDSSRSRNAVTSPYTSAQVANIPPAAHMVGLQYAGMQTLSFSQALANPVFAYVSLNGNGYGFNQDFDIVSVGSMNGKACGYWGCGTSYKQLVGSEYQLLGTGEPHGTIRFAGAFSSVTWRSLSNEYWNGFTVGVQGTAAEVFTPSPTLSPSLSPTRSPTLSPSFSPTLSPTSSPSASPTSSPTHSPTFSPSLSPTSSPTLSPTFSPSLSPTLAPTYSPTFSPSLSPTSSPTLSPTECTDPTCYVVEDPHITVFDGAQVSLDRGGASKVAAFGWMVAARWPDTLGHKWLVKSPTVFIQAKYEPDPDLPEKNMFTRAVAVGGPFLGSNRLVIGSLGNSVTWNGRPVLVSIPSNFQVDGIMMANSDAEAPLVQDRTKRGPGLSFELPLGVKLLVNRYESHVNLAITMKKGSEVQDGLCGNMNDFPGDDLPELVEARTPADVAPLDSLFE